jgi:hypothetical protein
MPRRVNAKEFDVVGFAFCLAASVDTPTAQMKIPPLSREDLYALCTGPGRLPSQEPDLDPAPWHQILHLLYE